jgi:hypothetical protein
MRRAGPWLLHPGGVSGWFRDASGMVVPSRHEQLCAIPVWIVEDVHARGRVVRVIDAVVEGRTRRTRVTTARFAALTWMRRLGVDVDAIPPETHRRLVEAIERLSAPVPTRDAHDAVTIDQVAAQARTDDLLALLRVVRDTTALSASNDTSPKVAHAR